MTNDAFKATPRKTWAGEIYPYKPIQAMREEKPMIEPTITYCEKCGGIKSVMYNATIASTTAATPWAMPSIIGGNNVTISYPPEPAYQPTYQLCTCPVSIAPAPVPVIFCEQCGYPKADVPGFVSLKPGGQRCQCPVPKHDGMLDEKGYGDVSYGRVYVGMGKTGKSLFVNGIHLDSLDESVQLRPQQALSLLVWLEQEKSELERLAKEQEEWMS